jgi:hypothetical protein
VAVPLGPAVVYGRAGLTHVLVLTI